MTEVLFNPLSNNGAGGDAVRLKELYPEKVFNFSDITKIENIKEYIMSVPEDCEIIITGGDGTLNRFVNSLEADDLKRKIYYFPLGSGNDFYNDVKDRESGKLICLNKYIKNLPTVTINGKSSKFLNGIGYGIDGEVCKEGDKQREKGNKKINYTSIAIKSLLFKYKPVNAEVIIDGVEKKYKKVYLAPAMNGRFYGGGMMVAPSQNRLSVDGKISLCVAHGTNRFNILRIFPTIFKGAHLKYGNIFDVMKGDSITVRFDSPTALQIDGETVTDVLEYSAETCNISSDEKMVSAVNR